MTFRPQSEPSAPHAEFRKAVKSFVEASNVNRARLAREFEVAQTTVDRWWLGTASPHRVLELQVLHWMENNEF